MSASASTNAHVSIVIVTGSVRPRSFSSKAAAFAGALLERRPGVRVRHVEPAELALPPPGLGEGHPDVARLRALFDEADGVLLVTPEYQGSFSSVLKLVLEHLGWPAEIQGKPVGLLGVAAGRIGALKSLEHLRSVCAHLGAHTLPQAVSVAEVQRVFGEDGACLDEHTARAIDELCAHLVGEARARKQLRPEGASAA